MKNFVNNSWWLKAASCCCKTHHLRFFLKDLVTPLKWQYYSISYHWSLSIPPWKISENRTIAFRLGLVTCGILLNVCNLVGVSREKLFFDLFALLLSQTKTWWSNLFSTYARFSESDTTPSFPQDACLSESKKCLFAGNFSFRTKWMIPRECLKNFIVPLRVIFDPFLYPLKDQKIWCFLVISGGTDRVQWHKIG